MWVWVATIRIALVRCLNRDPTLFQTAEDAKSDIRRNLILELLNCFAVQSLDSQIRLHQLWVDLE